MPHKGLGKCLPLWQGAQVAADTTLVSPVTRAGDAQPNADRIAGTRWTGMLAVAAQSALATKPPLGDLLANARDAGAVPVSRLRLKDDRGSRRSGARGRTSVGGRLFAPRLSPCARVDLREELRHLTPRGNPAYPALGPSFQSMETLSTRPVHAAGTPGATTAAFHRGEWRQLLAAPRPGTRAPEPLMELDPAVVSERTRQRACAKSSRQPARTGPADAGVHRMQARSKSRRWCWQISETHKFGATCWIKRSLCMQSFRPTIWPAFSGQCRKLASITKLWSRSSRAHCLPTESLRAPFLQQLSGQCQELSFGDLRRVLMALGRCWKHAAIQQDLLNEICNATADKAVGCDPRDLVAMPQHLGRLRFLHKPLLSASADAVSKLVTSRLTVLPLDILRAMDGLLLIASLLEGETARGQTLELVRKCQLFGGQQLKKSRPSELWGIGSQILGAEIINSRVWAVWVSEMIEHLPEASRARGVALLRQKMARKWALDRFPDGLEQALRIVLRPPASAEQK
eukprot:s873_g5.t1